MTLAGFVLSQLHELPKPGDHFVWGGWRGGVNGRFSEKVECAQNGGRLRARSVEDELIRSMSRSSIQHLVDQVLLAHNADDLIDRSPTD